MQYIVTMRAVDADVWLNLPQEIRDNLTAGHMALGEDLEKSGEYVGGAALSQPEAAFTVQLKDGTPVVTDGPYAEVKEYVTGYYLIDVDSKERAIEIASKVPDAQFTRVEVRPVVDLTSPL